MINETSGQDLSAGRPADPDPARWPPSEVTAVVVVAVAGLMVSLNQSVLVPVLPQVRKDIGSSTTSTEWLLTSTLLAAAIAVPIVGRLGDLYGKRLMLMVCAGFLTTGSLICALSHSLVPLVIGRAVTGLALATISLGVSLINVTLPPRRASTGVALVSAMLGIGGAFGLPLAGLIGEHADYHLLFWIGVVGGCVSLIGSSLFLAESGQRPPGRFDFPGAVVFALFLVCLLLPLSEAATWGWGAPRTLGLLAAAAVLLAVFILMERKRWSPLVDLTVNARPTLLLTNAASVCVGFALFASLIGTASYVEAPVASGYGFGASIVIGGLCLLPSGLAMLALSPVSAMVTRRFGPKVTLCIGALGVSAGFVIRIVLAGHLWEIVLGTMVTGAGTGVAYASMPALIALGAPRAELAAANGLNALSRLIGSSTASAIGGTILASSVIVVGGVALPSLTAYQILFALCAGAALAAAGIALIVPYPPGFSPGKIAVALPAQWDASPATGPAVSNGSSANGSSANGPGATAVRPPAVE